MDVDFLVSLVQEHHIDAVHPGYGFLSESAEFARRMEQVGVLVIGPGSETLRVTGDKVQARQLAAECGVPVLEAMQAPTTRAEDVLEFVRNVGLPVMVKAVDGGGGRGIRLVRRADEVHAAVQRCIAESPSSRVFAEKAAVDSFRHIEVQIVGDGAGNISHVWERDCSVQRRFQKIIEVAPTPAPVGADRTVVDQAIKAAVLMAKKIKYLGLGTWEFLVNVEKGELFFLEINPRLQVEHTVTESLINIDLVVAQIQLAQGVGLYDLGFHAQISSPTPQNAAIQLRVCAEDPGSNFALSIGRVTQFVAPHGNGVRVDSHLLHGGIIGSDFDNLVAKIIVTASSWDAAVRKARRALADTHITGVKTNLNLLRAIVATEDFEMGRTSTTWLEDNLSDLVLRSGQIAQEINALQRQSQTPSPSLHTQNTIPSPSAVPLRKGDAWAVTLSPIASTNAPSSSDASSQKATTTTTTTANKPPSHLTISKLLLNDFPTLFSAEIIYTAPTFPQPRPFRVRLERTRATASTTSSTHRRGDAANAQHIVCPMSGRLVEVVVEEGDVVREGDVVAYVKQMKMELEIRADRAGRVKWVIEEVKGEGAEEEGKGGDEIAEGTLLVELELEDEREQEQEQRQAATSKDKSDLRGKL